MTPAEEATMKAVIEKVTNDAMNEGLRAAAQMIRIAALAPAPISLDQLADLIEETVK
jgi:hypothetical protein